jgi:hypothetical protein
LKWGVGRAGGGDYATLYEMDLSTGVWTNKITLFGMGQDNETTHPIDIAFPAVASPGAVPEPSTWGLLILGFGAAGSMIRRRRAPALPSASLPA